MFDGSRRPCGRAGAPEAHGDEIREPPLTPPGELDETRLVTGAVYRLFDSTLWRWNGRELVSVEAATP